MSPNPDPSGARPQVPHPTASGGPPKYMMSTLAPPVGGAAAGDIEFEEDLSLEKNEDNPVYRLQSACVAVCTHHSQTIQRCIVALLLAGYTVYFGFAVHYSVQHSMALIVITALVLALIVYRWVRDHYGTAIQHHCFSPLSRVFDNNWFWIKWSVIIFM